MDVRVRGSSDGGDLERYLCSEASRASGVLTKQLLTRHLWWDFAPGNREVLLQLMMAFKLVHPLADADTFLVPAMLPQCELPPEYVSPHWWCPSRAYGTFAALVQDPHAAQRCASSTRRRAGASLSAFSTSSKCASRPRTQWMRMRGCTLPQTLPSWIGLPAPCCRRRMRVAGESCASGPSCRGHGQARQQERSRKASG